MALVLFGMELMPDHRRHRGPHPEDEKLFSVDKQLVLRNGTRDLSWLLSRGYATTSTVKLVGDRYALTERQRKAVARSACSDSAMSRREGNRIAPSGFSSEEIWIDGYNVITSLEAALSGGVILHARDGCYRDMASMHGNYRKVEETIPAIQLLGDTLADWSVSKCRWLLDRPVSNSGRLKTILTEMAIENGWPWTVDLVPDPDVVLKDCNSVVATADSQILDHCAHAVNLARMVIDQHVSAAWIVRLDDEQI